MDGLHESLTMSDNALLEKNNSQKQGELIALLNEKITEITHQIHFDWHSCME